jgi:hypothetical protein
LERMRLETVRQSRRSARDPVVGFPRLQAREEVKLLADAVVKTPGQLTIPARKRHIYKISPGDPVQIEIELTPYRYVPGQADTQ